MPRHLNEQKICGWCGATVVYKGDWLSVCGGCGYQRYINPNPCITVIIENSGKFLLVKRNIEPRKGYLDFPGGFMDMTDNSLEETAYRELQEEVGILPTMVSPLVYIQSQLVPYEWQQTELNNIVSYYHCKLLAKTDEIQLDVNENSAYIWVGHMELPKLHFAWEADKQVALKLLGGSDV